MHRVARRRSNRRRTAPTRAGRRSRHGWPSCTSPTPACPRSPSGSASSGASARSRGAGGRAAGSGPRRRPAGPGADAGRLAELEHASAARPPARHRSTRRRRPRPRCRRRRAGRGPAGRGRGPARRPHRRGTVPCPRRPRRGVAARGGRRAGWPASAPRRPDRPGPRRRGRPRGRGRGRSGDPERLDGSLAEAAVRRTAAAQQRQTREQELPAYAPGSANSPSSSTRLIDVVHRDEVARAEQRLRHRSA